MLHNTSEAAQKNLWCPFSSLLNRLVSTYVLKLLGGGVLDILSHFVPACFTRWCQVYTVGPDYAHAEARKSPALDGKVERDSEGKEIRYPVMLTAMEKLVARKVCLAFKVPGSYLNFFYLYIFIYF